MILLLDTSNPVCKLTLIDKDKRLDDEWESDRNLAKNLLNYLNKKIFDFGKNLSDISGIGVFEGPGGFTGIRIGLTVLNTVADAQSIPIVGARGDDWQSIVLEKLHSGKNEKIVLPFYGSEANITVPRK